MFIPDSRVTLTLTTAHPIAQGYIPNAGPRSLVP